MSELILLGVIAVLAILLAFKERENRLERGKYLNALMSRNAQEMANLELADKTKIKAEIPKQPDLVPPESLSQEDWEKVIKQ